MTRLEELRAQLADRLSFRAKCLAVPQYETLSPDAEIARLREEIATEEANADRVAAARATAANTMAIRNAKLRAKRAAQT